MIRRLDLPLPPSANRRQTIARGGRRLVKTTAYREWLDEGQLVYAYSDIPKETLEGSSRVYMLANIDRRRDLDNLLKCSLDGLQGWGAIKDDRWIDTILLRRDLDGELDKGTMRIEWEPMGQ